MQDNNSGAPRYVQGELIDASSRVAPQQLLAMARAQIAHGTGLPSFLEPRERHQISKRLQRAQLEEVVNLGVDRLHEEADTKIVEIELMSEQRRATILSLQNQSMGDLKREQCSLAAEAMTAEVQAEQHRQQEIRACDCLEEDREMLTQLYRRRALTNINRIALEHGVDLQPFHGLEPNTADR